MNNQIKKIGMLSLLLGLIFNCYGQGLNFAENQVKVWELTKTRTIAVAQAMPAEKYNYKPNPQVMSFGQQIAHISNSMLSMNARFIAGTNYSGREKNASTQSKAQLIADLESSFDKVIASLKSMNDQSLKAQGKRHGAFPLTKWQSFLFMRDHITNHRAKAVLYLRMNNITPPAYGFN